MKHNTILIIGATSLSQLDLNIAMSKEHIADLDLSSSIDRGFSHISGDRAPDRLWWLCDRLIMHREQCATP